MKQDSASIQKALARLDAALGAGEANGAAPSAPATLKDAMATFEARLSTTPSRTPGSHFGSAVDDLSPTLWGARERVPPPPPDLPGLGESLQSAGRTIAGYGADAVLSMPEMLGRFGQLAADTIEQGRAHPTVRGQRNYAVPQTRQAPSQDQLAAADTLRGGGTFLVELAKLGKEDTPKGDPRLVDDFLFGKVPGALGQIGATLMSGGAAGVPGMMAVSTAIGSTSLMDDVETALAEKVAKGEMTPEEAKKRGWTAFASGMALAVPDALAVGGMLSRADKATGGGVRSALGAITKSMGIEYLQEGSQTFGEEATFDWLTDQDRTVLERLAGASDAGGVGAVAAGIVESILLGGHRLARRGRRGPREAVLRDLADKNAAQTAQEPVQGPQPPEGPTAPPEPQAAQEPAPTPTMEPVTPAETPPAAAMDDGALSEAAEMGLLVRVQVPEGNMEGWPAGPVEAEVVETAGDSVLVRSRKSGRGRLVPKEWITGLAEADVVQPEAAPARPTPEEIEAEIGPMRTPEQVRADEIARRAEDGDRAMREALEIPEGEPLPDFAQAPPGFYEGDAAAGPAQMPTDEGLFGPLERPDTGPPPTAKGQAAAPTASMFDEQPGDLPGQRSLLDEAEDGPQSELDAAEAQLEQELVDADDDVPFDIPPEDAVTSDTDVPLFQPGDVEGTSTPAEAKPPTSKPLSKKMRDALHLVGEHQGDPKWNPHHDGGLHHTTTLALRERGLMTWEGSEGVKLTPEGRRVLEGRSQRKRTKSEAAKARRQKVIQEVLEGARGFRDYVRAMGGLRYDPYLWDRWSAKESGEKTPIGFSPIVWRKGSNRGRSVEDMALAAIEDDLLPGMNSRDIGLREMLELLESDFTQPRAERLAQEQMEAYYAEQADMLSEQYREQHGGGIAENEVWGSPRSNPTGSRTHPPAHPALPFPTQDHGRPGQPTPRAQAAPPIQPGKPISKPQVQEALADIVKAAGKIVPLRVGRLGPGMAGGFKVGPEVIRVREAFNLTAAAHEVFHALEKALYGFNPSSDPWTHGTSGVSRQVRAELHALGKAAYGKTKPRAGYPREGWAEFGRLWLFEQANARKLAPKTTAWFESKFLPQNPGVAEAISKAAQVIEQRHTQGALATADADMVDPTTPMRRIRAAISDVRRLMTKKAWIDIGEEIRKFSEAAQKTMGAKLPNSSDPWVLFDALRGTHDYRAAIMVNDAMIDLAGNPVGPSLDEALALVRGQREKFTKYLWGRQAQLYWNDPNLPGGRDPGLTLADANEIVNQLSTPRFELAENMIREWHEGVLNYAAQASPAFRKVVEAVRQSHPGYLMPLQRHFEELDNMWARAARRSGRSGPSQQRSPVQRMLGSGRRIREPFQDMVANARATILKAHQRAVLDAAIKLGEIEGLGGLIEKLPQDTTIAAQRTIDELVKEIERKFAGRGGISIQAAKGVNIQDLVGETIAFFAPSQDVAQRGEDGGYILPYWNGTSLDRYWVDAGLYDALAGMEVYYLPKWVEWTFGAHARAVRLGATGVSPAFGLITNPQIDLPSLWLNSQSSASTPKLLASWFYQVSRAGLSAATGGKIPETPEMRRWMRLGGPISQSLGQDTRHTRRAANKLFEGPVVRTLDPRNWLDGIREVFQFPESASRSTEIGLLLKERGLKAGDMLDLDTSLDILIAGKKVTTDFFAAGEHGRMWNRITPFFNASIQGPRSHLRAANLHPGRFLFRGMQLAVLTLAYWNEYKDEEWYNELPPRERFGYWHFKVGNEIIRIRRPFEVGAFFASLPEAMLDGWYRKDPKAAMEWLENTIETVTPPLIPSLAEEVLEQASNKDRYTERPIVPRGETDLPPAEQYSEYTSRVAIKLGEMFDVSPRRIDHAIRGTFANSGQELLNVLGLGAKRPEGYQPEPADTTIAGRLFLRGGTTPYQSKSVDQVWDLLTEHTMRQRSKVQEETPDQRQMRLQLGDATKAISALYGVRAHTNSAGKRREITAEILKLAREVLAAEEAGRVNRGRFSSERKRAQRLEDSITGQR